MSSDTKQSKNQKLSAEAKSFVPKNHLFNSALKPTSFAGRNHTAQNSYPRYVMTCYPFTSFDGGHSRPRLLATWEGPGRPTYLHSSELPAELKNTCLSGNGLVSSQGLPWEDLSGYSRNQVYSPYQCNPQVLPDTHVFSQSHTLPPGLALLDVQYPGPVSYPAAQSSPDVWMVTSGDNLPSSSQIVFDGGMSSSPVCKKMTKGISKQKKKVGFNSNQVTVGVQYQMNEQEAEQRKTVSKKRTMICKDCGTQTDFSNEIADKNLQTLPSPLYDEASESWTSIKDSTDSDDSEIEASYNVASTTRHSFPYASSSYPNSNTYMPLIHTNRYPMNSSQWRLDDGSLPNMSEDFRFCMYNDLPSEGINAMYNNRGYKVVHPSHFGFPEPFYSRPKPGFESEMNSMHSQKRGRHRVKRDSHHSSSGNGVDAGAAVGRTSSSVGTDSRMISIQEVEEEFPRLLRAAGELPSLNFVNNTAEEVGIFRRLVDDQSANIQQPPWIGIPFPHSTRQISLTNQECPSRGSKKKQKRLEQLSRAADEELAEISLEQQVLREMSHNHCRLIPSFRQEDGLLSTSSSSLSTNQPNDAVSDEVSGSLKNIENLEQPSQLTAENSDDVNLHDKVSVEFLHDNKHSESTETNKTHLIETLTNRERETNERDHDREILADTFISINRLDINSKKEDNTLICVDLSSSISSKTSSMDNGSRGSPLSTAMSPISQTSPFNMSSPTASSAGSGITSPKHSLNKSLIITSIHSSRFREYCNQVLSREIDDCCTELLQQLARYQHKYYQFDTNNGFNMAKRRTVLGLREVTKHLRQSKLRCVIISPNMEKSQSKGLDEALQNIIKLCEEQRVLFVFALGRHALGRALAKLVPVSVVGIFSCDGAEEHFYRLQQLTREARSAYQELVTSLLRTKAPVSVDGSVTKDMSHSRTPSGCSVMSLPSSILSEPISETELETEAQEVNEPDKQEQNNVLSVNDTTLPICDNNSNGLLTESTTFNEESDEDEEKVIICEKLEDYEADSENEQSLNSSKTGEVCGELASKASERSLLKSREKHFSQENGHSNQTDLDNGQNKTLPVSIRTDCTNHKLNSFTNHIESWTTAKMPISAGDQLSADIFNQKSLCEDVG